MTDTIVLHYNARREPYLPGDELQLLEKKRKRILLNKNIYQLTNNDRKLYPLIVDKKHITQPHDTVVYTFKNQKLVKLNVKVINVPASVHNNSDNTLTFYSMTCSWDEFWGTNCNDIKLASWPCESNFSKVITIAPHQEYKRTLNIIYYSGVKRGTEYQISMSLLKAPFSGKGDGIFGQEPYEYVRFNKIWSDKITIQ